MTQICSDLPRLYKIKRARKQLNQDLEVLIHQVPEPHHGVYKSLEDALIEQLGKRSTKF